ncbi:MAG: sugar transferase [Gemmatimonadota bacterium]|nr:sugar transferase [Gemmatimonadota bacterium]
MTPGAEPQRLPSAELPFPPEGTEPSAPRRPVTPQRPAGDAAISIELSIEPSPRWRDRGPNGNGSVGEHGVVTGTEVELDTPLHVVPETTPEVVPRRRSEVVNRGVNIVLASLALVVLSPLLLLIALVVKLSSPGPILYVQPRVGIDRRRRGARAVFDRRQQDLGGRTFTIYKFRSMYADAERDTGAVWATPNDPRVLPIGRFLRQFRLDELPQLVNVLKGEMNIVGPRPERPSIFLKLRRDISQYPLRQRAKPGLTGWAQVNHNYDSTIEDVRTKVRYDLEYLERQSLAEDVKIMLRTVPVMLFKRGGW